MKITISKKEKLESKLIIIISFLIALTGCFISIIVSMCNVFRSFILLSLEYFAFVNKQLKFFALIIICYFIYRVIVALIVLILKIYNSSFDEIKIIISKLNTGGKTNGRKRTVK